MASTYPIFLRDQARNRVEKSINPDWTLSRFIQMINAETSQQNDRIMVGVKEYSLTNHGNKKLKELGITPNLEVNLMTNYSGGL